MKPRLRRGISRLTPNKTSFFDLAATGSTLPLSLRLEVRSASARSFRVKKNMPGKAGIRGGKKMKIEVAPQRDGRVVIAFLPEEEGSPKVALVEKAKEV